jgi:hypothetical protein
MSYDHIWLCPSLKRMEWTEATTKSRKLTPSDEICSDAAMEKERLPYWNTNQDHAKFAVSISMTENVLVDELYLFLNERDARRFFQGGPLAVGEQCYHDREYLSEDLNSDGCLSGKGFDSVRLVIQDELIAEHSGSALVGRRYIMRRLSPSAACQ